MELAYSCDTSAKTHFQMTPKLKKNRININEKLIPVKKVTNSRVHLEKLIVAYLANKYPPFYIIRKFITACTAAHHWFLPQNKSYVAMILMINNKFDYESA
jgi:hypothetical protein